MRLTLLGTGTPSPSLTRQSAGYLVEVGSDVIVLDHGPGAAHRLMEAGRRPQEVTHALFTHLHYDHIADYPRLVLQRWDQGAGRLPALSVAGPPPMAETTRKLFGPDGVYGPDIEARVSFAASQDVSAARGGPRVREKPAPAVREVAPGDVIEGEGWRATAGPARHFQPFLACISWRIDAAAGSLVYSGDSGGVLQGLVDLAAGADVLVHMCHFVSGTEPSEAFRLSCGGHMDVAEVARRAGVGTLVLTHFPPPLDRPGVMERIVADVATVFSGTVIAGRDLMRVPLRPDAGAAID